MEQLYAKNIIDMETEAHYSFQSTLKKTKGIHYHDFFEFFIITEGKVIHVVNNTEQLLEEGTLVFIRPNDCHYYMDVEGNYCNFINLAFPQNVVEDLFRYLGNSIDTDLLLSAPISPSVKLSKSDCEVLKKKLQNLNLIPLSAKRLKRAKLRAFVVDIFTQYMILKSRSYEKKLSDWLDITISEMKLYDNIKGGVPAMIKLSGRTHEHLCREMKKQLGITPTEFVNMLRIDFASNLLLTTDTKIIDIAADCGFETLSHFFHLFKKKMGISPNIFRKNGSKMFNN